MHLKFKPVAVAILVLVVLMFLVRAVDPPPPLQATLPPLPLILRRLQVIPPPLAPNSASALPRSSPTRLDAAVTGFIEALAAAGYVEGKNITFDRQNA